MNLSPLEVKLVEQIKINSKLTNAEYAVLISTTKGSIASAVLRLRNKGVLKKFEGSSGRKEEEYVLLDFKVDYQGVIDECEIAGIPAESVNHGWYKGKQWSLHFKGQDKNYFEIRDEIIADMSSYAPVYPVINYTNNTEGHLLVIDPADIHIGKLCSSFETGEDYNSQIAVQRVKEGVHGILSKAQGFAIDKILFIIGNDVLHVDTPKNTTTSGTSQDVSGMWYDNFLLA